MRASEELMRAAIESDELFGETLYRVIREDLNLNAAAFAEEAGVPLSTIYKIRSGNRAPNIKTVRQIIATVRKYESSTGDFVAIIAARMVLETITETKRKINGRLITIKEYSASSIEEAIIAAANAERDGAKALVCAPIISRTVEKIVSIPVITIVPKESIDESIELAVRKAL